MSSLSVHPGDLEPSLVGERTYVTRRRFTRIDAAKLLSLMICLLFLLPAALVLPGMTDIGRPGLVVGLLLWCWWVLARLNPQLVLVGPQPVRWAVLIYMLALMGSYAVGFLRGLTGVEANGADRAMLSMAVFNGIILTAADGIPNWERFKGLLRVLVYCAAFMAVLGLVQFSTKMDITQYLMVPGLQAKGWVPDFSSRGGGFSRVASTAGHYIEFSTVMAMILPLAVHFALYAPERKQRRRFMVMALLLAAAVPVALSRTGILALAVVLIVMTPIWSWRIRYNILGFTAGLMAFLIVGRPGLLGSLRDMFTNADKDSSITARTERYGLVAYYFKQRPWLGRGTGTWIPPQYQILDNEWLTLSLSNGLVGVAALAILHIVAITLAAIALRRSTTPEDRHLCGVLIAAQVIAIVVAATFDSLSFTTFASTLALMTGFCGLVWRFTHPARTVRTSTTRKFGE